MLNSEIFLRVDTLPYEIPLIFNNKLLTQHVLKDVGWNRIDNYCKEFTKPYNFFIQKNEQSKRLLSLVHPISQLQMTKFIEINGQELIDFCKQKAIFSVRYPSDYNSVDKIVVKNIQKEIDKILGVEADIKNNDDEDFVDSYFRKMRFTRITDFYKSDDLIKMETKYAFLLKMDIQSCFYNIYTHSIEWAHHGDKELAKELIKRKNRSSKDRDLFNNLFGSVLDKVMQNANYNETNGIVVGPEFSRCVAEIILTRIDNYVHRDLQEKQIRFKRDYEIYRYIDDIFVFCNDRKTADEILALYQYYCTEYKMNINETKVQFEKRPFMRRNLWVPQIKEILAKYFSRFDDTDSTNPELDHAAEETNDVDAVAAAKDKKLEGLEGEAKKRKRWPKRAHVNLIEEIRKLFVEYEDQQPKIVSYIFTYFSNRIETILDSSNTLETSGGREYMLCSILDFLHYILSYSITSEHVIKYAKLMIILKLHAQENEYDRLIHLLFKKAFNLLQNYQDRKVELLNLIIVLKWYARNLPEELLLKYLGDKLDYFSLAAVSFYIDTDARKFRYRKLVKKINELLLRLMVEVNEKYLENSNGKEEFIKSDDFYIFHDFCLSSLRTSETKREMTLLAEHYKNINWDGVKGVSPLFKLFVKHALQFSTPFMDWNIDEKGIILNIIKKTNRASSTAGAYS